jgi:hypothetical protein
MSVDLPERRFAGAVFAHERVDLTRQHTEIDPAQRADARKGLADALHVEQRYSAASGDHGVRLVAQRKNLLSTAYSPLKVMLHLATCQMHSLKSRLCMVDCHHGERPAKSGRR